ncbi:MAG: hypothetical protein IJT34_08490, partial [Butyrivibrio sp.]|nr:hypothetical protein [Butyrivibrio sp.]
AQAMYDVSSIVYRRFAVSLAEVMVDIQGETGSAYTEIYNLTHGFKYQGMLVALLLGAMVTAIFLDDRQMEGAVGLITLIYMISTIWIGMGTISLLGHSIGVVWSSVIFHVLETIGLITIARYLRLRYRGV